MPKKKLTEIKVGNLYYTKISKKAENDEIVFVVRLHEQFTTEAYIFSEQVEYYYINNPKQTYLDNLGHAQYSWIKL